MRFHWRLLIPLLVLAALSGCRDGQPEAPEVPALVYKIVSQWGSEGDGPGEFDGLQGLAVDVNDRIHAADAENCRVQVFDNAGQFLHAFGRCGDGPGKFRKPMDVAVDSSGIIYVVDFMRDRVEVFDQQGNYLRDWGREGEDAGEFSAPVGVAVDREGNVYVSESTITACRSFRRREKSWQAGAEMGKPKGSFTIQGSSVSALMETCTSLTRTTLESRSSTPKGASLAQQERLAPGRGSFRTPLTW